MVNGIRLVHSQVGVQRGRLSDVHKLVLADPMQAMEREYAELAMSRLHHQLIVLVDERVLVAIVSVAQHRHARERVVLRGSDVRRVNTAEDSFELQTPYHWHFYIICISQWL